MISTEGGDVGKQKSWSEFQANAKAVRLLEESHQVSRAYLLAAARRESGVWLPGLPTSTLGILLDFALALRVRADVCKPHWCRGG